MPVRRMISRSCAPAGMKTSTRPGRRTHVGFGHRHDDDEGGSLEAGREPLLAVDHPLVAVVPGRGGEQRRVCSALRLGHRVARRDPDHRGAARGTAPSALACRSGRGSPRCPNPGPGTRIRSGRGGATQYLVHIRQADLSVALTPELGRQVGRPQTLGPHAVLEGHA